MTDCEHCKSPLSKSQWYGVDFKSCPSCSQQDGHQHRFHLSEDFGHSEARPVDNPIQSHCPSCRSGHPAPGDGLRCDEVIDLSPSAQGVTCAGRLPGNEASGVIGEYTNT